MTIEEILKEAGITDAEAVEKVKAAMPSAFLPLEEHNKRIAKAKQTAEDVQKAFDAFKAETEKANEDGAGKREADEKAIADLREQLEKLQGEYTASQNELKQGNARRALEKALNDAGANPAALALLAGSALGRVEFGEDGKPSNIEAVAKAVKEENGGLFGKQVDTGSRVQPADKPNEEELFEGFGETKRR